MDLKSFLPNHKKEEPIEYFWSLIIEPGWVQAGIWRITGETAQVVHGSTPYPWELEDELVNSADTALAGAIQGFPEGIDEPSKTVFGVLSSWVSEGQIKDEHLEKIKRVCSDLSLTPIGFVVIPEAISHLLKSEEKAPLSAVLVGVYKEILEVSVYKLGNLMGTAKVNRTLSIIDDVTEGIARFAKGDSVPSRIVLFGGKDSELEDTKRTLDNVSWDNLNNTTFLHSPGIELVGYQRKVDAISLAGASEVSGVTSLEGQKEEVSEELAVPLEELQNISEVQPEDAGFVVDGDVEPESFAEQQMSGHEVSLYDDNEEPNAKHRLHISFPKLAFGRLSRTLTIVLIGIILLIVVSFAAWWYIPKATITLYISPRNLNEKVEITVDPSVSASNTENKVLAGETVKTNVKGEKTAQTTGTKTVGDKAQGEVTLYRVGTKLSLKSGTILKGPDSLRFVLDGDTDVPAGTASTPGTVTAKVSAEAIGAEYNLAESSSFTVGNYTTADIEAKNDADFSGGSSKEISAVSSDDQKTLEKDLTLELSEKAKDELNSTLSDTDIFIDDSITTTVSSREFTQKVGDEAKSFGLKINLDATAVTVKKSELLALAQDQVKEKVPNGYVLREDQIDTTFAFKKKDGNVYKFDVTVSANLLPVIDTEVIAQKVRGKVPTFAQDYLIKEVPGFARAEITIKPNLPGKLKTLPQVTKHIDVEIAAER
jgi:hypothetical protein